MTVVRGWSDPKLEFKSRLGPLVTINSGSDPSGFENSGLLLGFDVELAAKVLADGADSDASRRLEVCVLCKCHAEVGGEFVIPKDRVARCKHAARNRFGSSQRGVVGRGGEGGFCLRLRRPDPVQGRRTTRVVLVLEQMVELRNIGHNGELVRFLTLHHVLGVKEGGDTKLLLSHGICKLVVLQNVFRF